MPQFLFVVDISNPEGVSAGTNVSSQWNDFETKSNELPPTLFDKKLSRNVWLFDSKKSLPELLKLTNLVEKCGVNFKAFLISGEVIELTKDPSEYMFKDL